MATRPRYRRKAPSYPELQGLFFNKTPDAHAFFNPLHQRSKDSGHTTAQSITNLAVQRQEGMPSSANPEEEEVPTQAQAQEKGKEVPTQAQEKEEG
ncbi:MAG: hypothetical protein IGR76_19080 [Synechococcales cyanobacterium T60_A2020_003]|nr:hypothetical protein [Synechococcales cyanobacterium T60_A2020_003]